MSSCPDLEHVLSLHIIVNWNSTHWYFHIQCNFPICRQTLLWLQSDGSCWLLIGQSLPILPSDWLPLTPCDDSLGANTVSGLQSLSRCTAKLISSRSKFVIFKCIEKWWEVPTLRRRNQEWILFLCLSIFYTQDMILSYFHVLYSGKMMMERKRRKQINQSPSRCWGCAIFSASHWPAHSTSRLWLAETSALIKWEQTGNAF